MTTIVKNLLITVQLDTSIYIEQALQELFHLPSELEGAPIYQKMQEGIFFQVDIMSRQFLNSIA